MKVNVNTRAGGRGDVIPVELTPDDEYPKGWTVTLLATGENIGRVYKDSYNYSPPVHRGSRIARYRKRVSSWGGVAARRQPGEGRYRYRRTRREVLVMLILRHRGEV